jgi:hypothetical protein
VSSSGDESLRVGFVVAVLSTGDETLSCELVVAVCNTSDVAANCLEDCVVVDLFDLYSVGRELLSVVGYIVFLCTRRACELNSCT